ncbi:unnamed protein product, partial [Heterosigma akashiwo]
RWHWPGQSSRTGEAAPSQPGPCLRRRRRCATRTGRCTTPGHAEAARAALAGHRNPGGRAAAGAARPHAAAGPGQAGGERGEHGAGDGALPAVHPA